MAGAATSAWLGSSVPPLPRRLTLQYPDGPAVAADHALELLDVALLDEVVQHLQDAPRARVERRCASRWSRRLMPSSTWSFLYIVHIRRKLGVVLMSAALPGRAASTDPRACSACFRPRVALASAARAREGGISGAGLSTATRISECCSALSSLLHRPLQCRIAEPLGGHLIPLGPFAHRRYPNA